jgi:hypothetical protein
LPARDESPLVVGEVISGEVGVRDDEPAARPEQPVGFGEERARVLGVAGALQGPDDVERVAGQPGGAEVGDVERDLAVQPASLG